MPRSRRSDTHARRRPECVEKKLRRGAQPFARAPRIGGARRRFTSGAYRRIAMKLRHLIPLVAVSAGVASNAGAELSGPLVTLEITVTNLTKGQTFTPILAASHAASVGLFELGEAAGPELEALAEAGDTAPFESMLSGLGDAVADVTTAPGLLGPGESRVIRIQAPRRRARVSAAAMLLPTNDTFVALDGVAAPTWGSRTFLVPAYDAGTEENDQDCASIPGPLCGGEAHSMPADGDEGHVYIGNGFHELGSGDAGDEILGPLDYDWRNPVARVMIRRVAD